MGPGAYGQARGATSAFTRCRPRRRPGDALKEPAVYHENRNSEVHDSNRSLVTADYRLSITRCKAAVEVDGAGRAGREAPLGVSYHHFLTRYIGCGPGIFRRQARCQPRHAAGPRGIVGFDDSCLMHLSHATPNRTAGNALVRSLTGRDCHGTRRPVLSFSCVFVKAQPEGYSSMVGTTR